VTDGGEILEAGDDLVLAHDRYRLVYCSQALGISEVHAFRALQIEKMSQRLFTERQQGQADRCRVVPGGLGQVGA
jgi:hypothetical protein